MIKLKNIHKHYFNNAGTVKQEVLKDISLEIKPGDAIAILGPSGCGKSTLLNMIGSLDKPTSGSIVFDGVDLASLNDKELSEFRNKHIGFIFQMHHLMPQLTVLENVLLPTLANPDRNKEKDQQRAKDLLSVVGLEDKIHQFPGQLSGGECQRATVVRALINESQIILADEPTGSLDHKSAGQVGDLLVKMQQQQKVALIVVTHSRELANKMQTAYELIDGSLKQM